MAALLVLPVRCLNLPQNLELVDLCVLSGLPIFWMLFVLGRQTVIAIWPYAFAMVLIVASLDRFDDIERAIDAGIDDFVPAPANKSELLKRVENLLKLSHQ